MKLPRGKHIKSASVSDISRILLDLKPDFRGAVRFRARFSGANYTSDLLIDEGRIVAASLSIESGERVTSNKALIEFGNKILYSKGRIDLFYFTAEEMSRSLNNNEGVLLATGVAVAGLEVKFDGKTKRIGEMESPINKIKCKIRGLFGRKNKGATKTHAKGKTGDDIRKKYGIQAETREEEGGRDAPEPREKVTTGIDELYNLLKQKETLKVTDGLAKKLGIGRNQVIEWGEILEKHEMLEIHYSTIGATEFRLVDDRS